MKPLASPFGLTLSLVLALSAGPAAHAITFTNDSVIGVTDATADYGEIVVSNCTLTVDGAHTFSNVWISTGGRLTHSFAADGYVASSRPFSVSNELYVLTGTNASVLANGYVDVSTITVSNDLATVLYSTGVDYTITADTNHFVSIQRTETSGIPDGGTVSVNYTVAFPAVPSGLNLVIDGDLRIDAGARIDVSGRGYGGTNGPGRGASAGSPPAGGGGGHGGYGGNSSSNAAGGLAFDSTPSPTDKGGAGGAGSGGYGGNGGGAIKIIVNGALQIDGAIVADGFNATNSRSGGGAGGSIWLEAQTIAGSGAMSANGGAGEPIHGGGGGGGRIAVPATQNLFSGSMQACGGLGFVNGGAGTIYARSGDTPGTVLMDNAGRVGTNTVYLPPVGADVLVTGAAIAAASDSQTVSNVVVGPGSRLIVGNYDTLTAWGDVTIQAGAMVFADGLGYGPKSGMGVGGTIGGGSLTWGGGAGHGGYGGYSPSPNPSVSAGGTGYGSVTTPTMLGSGGGGQMSIGAVGGSGGGGVRLIVGRTLQIDGRISANGAMAIASGGGGGSGGSVWLTADTLAGSGSISADGGDGIDLGGGGGGGRIALEYSSKLFSGAITAFGGNGGSRGGAGTIYSVLLDGGVPVAKELLLDNDGIPGTNTPLLSVSGPSLTIRAAAVGVGGVTVSNLLIGANSELRVLTPSGSTTVSVSGDAVVEDTGAIIAEGPSGGGTPYGNGGSHGGYGGYGTNGSTGQSIFGSVTAPMNTGNPGTQISTSGDRSGYGGGAVYLRVTRLLLLNGTLSGDGGAGTGNGPGAGGGAGGSVRLEAKTLAGTGRISASGGSGIAGGGGGGGGRVAIDTWTNSFNGTVSAQGAPGYRNGGPGTICYLSQGQPFRVELDNGGLEAETSPLTLPSLPFSVDLELKNRARAVTTSTATAGDVVIRSNSWLSVQEFQLSMGTCTVEPGAAITADGDGYPNNIGTGAGGYSGSIGGGGGHAGYGGMGSNAVRGGFYYDSITAPTMKGGAGGDMFYSSGAGGGVIRVSVFRELRVDGKITANGLSPMNYPPVTTTRGGGGAGGSILITVGTLTGNGVICANGGDGFPVSGGGSGGRIAIYYQTNLFAGTVAAWGGNGYQAGAAGTIYTRRQPDLGLLLVDNGDRIGAWTPLAPFASEDATIARGGIAFGVDSPIRNLVVASNGWLIASNTIVTAVNATIQSGGGIIANGIGYRGSPGPGGGTDYGAGGGHGGYGGANRVSGGGAYGSVMFPTTAGSAGDGNSLTTPPFPGPGGGVIRLAIFGELMVDGSVSANGLAGLVGTQSEPYCNSGGGAGGSIWITAGTLSGSGNITANGGPGLGNGSGGGGGGRIALYYASNNFAGTVTASGGDGTIPGGAGTIYMKADSQSVGRVSVDNGGLIGTNTPWSSAFQLPALPFDLAVAAGARLAPEMSLLLLSNLTVNAGGVVAKSPAQSNLWIGVVRDARIEPGGAISATGTGYGTGTGPGAGASVGQKGSGGGHGGVGGASASGAPGGTNYGSTMQPTTPGSGGGAGLWQLYGGSEGGGAIRLSVGGQLIVDGSLESDGNLGLNDDAGGGAGGSVWVRAAAVSGGGTISANGGDGELYGGGGGGGGRIAIYSPANTFTGIVSVLGGNGASTGTTGSIFTSTSIESLHVVSQAPQGVFSNVVNFIEFTFNDAVMTESVSASDFTVLTPAGAIAQSNLAISATGLTTLRVSFPIQNALGEYQVTAGPDLLDILGQPMAGAYTGSFTVVLPTISGTVTDTNGLPVAGVLLQPTVVVEPPGELTGAVTDENGHYVLGVPPGWNGLVVPSAPSLMFNPRARAYVNVTASVEDQDYVAIGDIAVNVRWSAAGTNLLMSWQGFSGITYQVYSSTNLTEWAPFGDPVPGANAVIEVPLPVDSDPLKFFRLGASN